MVLLGILHYLAFGLLCEINYHYLALLTLSVLVVLSPHCNLSSLGEEQAWTYAGRYLKPLSFPKNEFMVYTVYVNRIHFKTFGTWCFHCSTWLQILEMRRMNRRSSGEKPKLVMVWGGRLALTQLCVWPRGIASEQWRGGPLSTGPALAARLPCLCRRNTETCES